MMWKVERYAASYSLETDTTYADGEVINIRDYLEETNVQPT